MTVNYDRCKRHDGTVEFRKSKTLTWNKNCKVQGIDDNISLRDLKFSVLAEGPRLLQQDATDKRGNAVNHEQVV